MVDGIVLSEGCQESLVFLSESGLENPGRLAVSDQWFLLREIRTDAMVSFKDLLNVSLGAIKRRFS